MAKTHTLANGNTLMKDDRTGDKIVQPGDTIILPENGGSIYAGVLQGTADSPIIILPNPKGTRLTAGFDFRDTQHVEVRGGGRIVIDSGIDGSQDISKVPDSVAVHIYGKAKNVKISGIVFRNVGMGLKVKNEPTCDQSLNDWVIRGIEFTDCEAENIRWEYVYAGSTDLGGRRANLNCPGGSLAVLPPVIGGFKILRHKIRRTGRAAIQVSLSSDAVTEIAFNDIQDAGLELSTEQGNGINIGGLSKVWVHHNKINRTFTHGIASLGGIDVTIEDNEINYSGYVLKPSDSGAIPVPVIKWAWGILVVTRPTDPIIQTRFTVQNNKIGYRGTGEAGDGGWQDIYIGDDVADGSRFAPSGSVLSGNISTVVSNHPAVVKFKQNTIKYAQQVPPPDLPVEPPVSSSRDFPFGPFIIHFNSNGSVTWSAKK